MKQAVEGSPKAAEVLAVWREVLEAMGRNDAVGYLRARCPEPRKASELLDELAWERRELIATMRAQALPPAVRNAMDVDLEEFYVQLQVEACRWSRVQGDEPWVWPWPSNAAQIAPATVKTLAILQDTSRRVLSELDLKHLLPLLVSRLAALTQSDRAFLALWDVNAHALEVVEGYGLEGTGSRRGVIEPDLLAALAADEGVRCLPGAGLPWMRSLLGARGDTIMLLAPLKYQGEFMGVLGCADATPHDHGEEAWELLSLFASQTTIALRNAAHYREIVQKATALRAANEQLLSVDRMKDQFLATVSHELRTPINFITGFGSALLADDEHALHEEHRYFVKKMLDGAIQLLTLVNNLLDMTSLREGQLTLMTGPLEPGVVMVQACEVFQHLAEQAGHDFYIDVPSGLPRLEADRHRLSQVIANLLANAIKYTPAPGRIVLRAEATPQAVKFMVIDTGAGIRPEDHGQLFRRFGQLEGGSSHRASGTGLGLAISKSLVEAHGGQIGVVSPPPEHLALDVGKGTMFWFTIPVHAE